MRKLVSTKKVTTIYLVVEHSCEEISTTVSSFRVPVTTVISVCSTSDRANSKVKELSSLGYGNPDTRYEVIKRYLDM